MLCAIIADPEGGAVDDAYLYRFFDDRYLLVVNAANSAKDWGHLSRLTVDFADVRLEDLTQEAAMLSLQGPQSKQMLSNIIGSNALPDPLRNSLSVAEYEQTELWVARTGYTGEPLCFELFLPAVKALSMWNALQDAGAQPVGLGARDTLRLEAGLPLYGHELGQDFDDYIRGASIDIDMAHVLGLVGPHFQQPFARDLPLRAPCGWESPK